LKVGLNFGTSINASAYISFKTANSIAI